ncbi:hypothetical protein F2Q69_00034971 [Brassica cretica]|uniref:Uncharacterized protein n=1 Tax=Brassica cretica TaxID=69181 RepID=A0A8S9SFI9_BRACR|nr:hypothetical protein F2Q69_00034971 [Brassica cretica]
MEDSSFLLRSLAALHGRDRDRDLSRAPASVDFLVIGDPRPVFPGDEGSRHGHEMCSRIHPPEHPDLKNSGLARYLRFALAGYPLPQIRPDEDLARSMSSEQVLLWRSSTENMRSGRYRSSGGPSHDSGPCLALQGLFLVAAWLTPLISEPPDMIWITWSWRGGKAGIAPADFTDASLFRCFVTVVAMEVAPEAGVPERARYREMGNVGPSGYRHSFFLFQGSVLEPAPVSIPGVLGSSLEGSFIPISLI